MDLNKFEPPFNRTTVITIGTDVDVSDEEVLGIECYVDETYTVDDLMKEIDLKVEDQKGWYEDKVIKRLLVGNLQYDETLRLTTPLVGNVLVVDTETMDVSELTEEVEVSYV